MNKTHNKMLEEVQEEFPEINTICVKQAKWKSNFFEPYDEYSSFIFIESECYIETTRKPITKSILRQHTQQAIEKHKKEKR